MIKRKTHIRKYSYRFIYNKMAIQPIQYTYTIHNRPTHAPYTVQLIDTNTEEYRTHLFVFKRKTDASKMARMLEAHFNNHGEWPSREISTDARLQIDGRDVYKNKRRKLEHFYIRKWSEEPLHDYIAAYLLHLMVFTKFSQGDVQMELHLVEYPIEYLKERFKQQLLD